MPKKLSRGPPKLPVQQLAILAICRFAEPIASTSVFPYLPEMIESFGVEKAEVAKWAGITSAVFSLSQCCTAIIWGRASDIFGRKPIILWGLTSTMIMSVMWGLSPSLPWAIVARTLSGGGNGNVGIIRTMVAEMVPEKELQPRAFSIMPLVWSIGSILGPAFGGFFAKPSENLPGLFGNNAFLIKFPFALPNLIAAAFFAVGIIVGILFLHETLETRRHKPDPGRFLGKKLVKFVKHKILKHPAHQHHLHLHREFVDDEDDMGAPLLQSVSNTSSKAYDGEWQPDSRPTPPPPRIWDVFTTQSTINLVSYTFLALHSMAFDQLLPIFMHHPQQLPTSENSHLPFKFSGGFGIGSGRIGTLFTLYGIIGGFVQFLVFPPIARHYGVLKCFRIASIIMPFVYFATPYTALIPSTVWQQVIMFSIMVVKSFCVIFAFPCSTIMLTNSAKSLRVLGTLNGVATSMSAVGRAAGPFAAGTAFTWGLEHGYVITAWWMLGVIAVIGAVPVFFLVEMEGFNRATESESDSSDNGEEEFELIPEESSSILDGDETVVGDEEAIDIIEGPSLSQNKSRRSNSQIHRESGAKNERRLSNPIGLSGESLGRGGGRRLSNGLGASNFGRGAGGTTFGQG